MIIQSIEVKGFRSLSNVRIAGFGPVNIFYGENNAGKSNILAALDIAFKVERVEDFVSPVAGFLRSELSNFVDNFSIGAGGKRAEKININVRLGIGVNDLKKLPNFDGFIKEHNIYEAGHLQRIQLEIEIAATSKNTAGKVLKRANVNNKLMYDMERPEIQRFFPILSKRVTGRQESVEELFLYIINCYGVIRAERFLQEELLSESPVEKMSVQKFKNWLLRLSESRGNEYDIFKRLTEWFNEKPFEYGFIRPIVEEGNVDLVVRENSSKELIIDRLGTGVQQILMLLSSISYSQARIIGIEEIELNLSPSLQNRTLSMLREIVGSGKGAIDQLFLTSHSMHLSERQDVILYAVERNDLGETEAKRGPQAIAQIQRHFNYGLIRIPRRNIWRQ